MNSWDEAASWDNTVRLPARLLALCAATSIGAAATPYLWLAHGWSAWWMTVPAATFAALLGELWREICRPAGEAGEPYEIPMDALDEEIRALCAAAEKDRAERQRRGEGR